MSIYDTTTGSCFKIPYFLNDWSPRSNITSAIYTSTDGVFEFIGYLQSSVKAREDWGDLLFFAEVEYLKSVG